MSTSRPLPVGATTRAMARGDVPDVVAAHLAHFAENVASRLGPRFVRTYVGTFVHAPHAYAAVAELDGQVVGYLLAVLDTRRHRRWALRRHGTVLAGGVLLGAARHPVLTSTLVGRRVAGPLRRRLARRGSPAAISESSTAGPVAVLSHLAVLPHGRGLGLGHRLVDGFVASARTHGARRACLATVAGADGAGRFYARQGWQPAARRRTRDGRELEIWERALRHQRTPQQ